MKSFEGKTAVVTGAASGIGRALAERFAEARMQVVLADIEQDALERATRELEERQYQVIGVVTNTMIRDSVQSLADRAIEAFGKVHILCNNAGVASATAAPVWALPSSDWDWVMGVNFHGVLYGIQAFVPHMLEHAEESHIVNTASLAGLMPGGGPYGVSKHGVLALTEGLHRDLTAAGANIGASVLCPGFVNTNIFDSERNRPAELATTASGASEEMMIPLRAMLQQGMDPAEIADIVFRSIEEERVYILPHPAWDDFVRGRVEAVLARGAPVAMNLQALAGNAPEGENL